MRWLIPSAFLNFKKLSIDLDINNVDFDFVEPGELRFTTKGAILVRNTSIFAKSPSGGKMSTTVHRT